MPNGVVNRLERFLATGAGARFLEEAETEASAKEAAVQRRRDLAAELAETIRRQNEVRPELSRRAEEAWAKAKEAKAAYEALRDRAVQAGRASDAEFLRNLDARRTTEAKLLRSADRSILAGIEEADEALRTWTETYKNLHRFRSEKVTSWDGTDSWVKRYGTNEAGIDALKKGVEDAQKALERLALIADPTEEAIAEGLARVKAAIEATHGDPPPLVMQQFDSKGEPVGKPVEMPVAR